MIVVCPNCDTRYKMPEGMVLAGKRMRCATCEHRWTLPLDREDEAVAMASEQGQEASVAVHGDVSALPPEAGAGAHETATDPDEAAPEDGDLEDVPARGWLIWLAALLVGAAFAILAAAIWFERLDPARVPVVGSALSRFQPAPSTLVIRAEARLTGISSGKLLLDVQGEIVNRGRQVRALPPMKASLAGPQGVVRRWTIAAPAAELPPGGSVRFSSTLTDVPPGARQLRLVGR